MMPLHSLKEEMARSGAHVDSLVVLHTRTVDALAGYAKMVEKAEPSFKPIAEEFRNLHATQADRLARTLVDLGQDVDPDGTFMGTVNVAAVFLRATFDSIDEGEMNNIREGETAVLTAFDDAIEASFDCITTASLVDMRDALNALLRRTHHLD